MIEINNLTKRYANGFTALDDVSLTIKEGEILALLGPNGAGKTTLISIICGIVNKTSGTVLVDGYDINNDYRETRKRIGLVPQELTVGAFEPVRATVQFSRGLYGKKPDDDYVDSLLKDFSLYEKKDDAIRMLSGGMKRRVLICKALAHEPKILFLDEPTAGVDVSLRQDMWQVVKRLKENGMTIILTTHYIEEAEEIADRVGVINKGKLIHLADKDELMKQMGQKELTVLLREPIKTIPEGLSGYNLRLNEDGSGLIYQYDTQAERTGITSLLQAVNESGLELKDIETKQSSLEDIFVQMVGADAAWTLKP